jgi:hypothetical protein
MLPFEYEKLSLRSIYGLFRLTTAWPEYNLPGGLTIHDLGAIEALHNQNALEGGSYENILLCQAIRCLSYSHHSDSAFPAIGSGDLRGCRLNHLSSFSLQARAAPLDARASEEGAGGKVKGPH